jgi:surfeit locus 1 family protein
MGRRLKRFVFAPGWKMTLFVLVMLPVAVSLGFWQLDRAAEKRALETRYYERQGGLPIDRPVRPGALAFARVRLSGRYLPGLDYLVDNRVRDGRPGYWVVSVFAADDDRRWLVNRGWLAAPPQRSVLPVVPTPDGPVTLVGIIWPNTGLPPLLAADPWPDAWPRRVQRLDVARMAAADPGIVPVEVRLEAGQAGVFAAAPLHLDVLPERHQGYAVQWFALAGVLLIGYVIFGLTGGRVTA